MFGDCFLVPHLQGTSMNALPQFMTFTLVATVQILVKSAQAQK
jgi:hypothetical protein